MLKSEVLKQFNIKEAYFGPEQILVVDMGYVFEIISL